MRREILRYCKSCLRCVTRSTCFESLWNRPVLKVTLRNERRLLADIGRGGRLPVRRFSLGQFAAASEQPGTATAPASRHLSALTCGASCVRICA